VDWPVPSGDVVLTVIEAAAVLASAIAGMMVAAEKKLDIVGAYSLACLNAFGGGTVRDLLLDNRPFYWMERWWLLLAILGICVPFVYNARMYRLATELHRRSVRIDALGLALFTIAGVGIARQHDAPLVIAAMMGVVTGTMGGMMRDVVVNELPDLFRPGGLYATAALAGALAFIAGLDNGLPYTRAALIGVCVVFALRMLSLRHGVSVPAPHWQDEARPRVP
jgi:uncharacterized membrane protein YeiH